MKKRLIAITLAVLAMLTLAACGEKQDTDAPESTGSAEVSDTPSAAVITEDREGNAITIPESIERVMTFGPSNAEILDGLGCADKIVAVDTYTYVDGLDADLPRFDMTAPDAEQIISLNPDVLFVTSMILTQGDDPYKPIKDAGICVIYIPSSSSISGIMEDIKFIAAVMGETERGDLVVSDMQAEIDRIKAIGDTVEDRKTVYFELSAAPYLYSFGADVFLDEMISIIGADNVFGAETSWLSVSEESVISLNPDVILSSVNYIDNPVDEVLSRPGWEAVTAVQNEAVYLVDTNASTNPSQNIIKALQEMAAAVYPELYK